MIGKKLRRAIATQCIAPARRWLRVTTYHVTNRRPVSDPSKSGKFLLARIMGNDLHPRHGDGQMLRNLRFILEQEPDFSGCTKLFVLNRLFDPKSEVEAKKLINKFGAEALVIPFIPAEYAATGWDTEPFGGPDFFSSAAFLSLPPSMQNRMRIWACGPKIRYAMNINGARNAAIKVGQNRAEWTGVLDGNCIFSAAGFEQFRRDCLGNPFAPYIIIPMERLETNAEYTDREPNWKSIEEPQIALHETARQGFDEAFPYGFRDKTVLLKSLGVPGEWQKWLARPWMPNDNQDILGKYFYKYTRGGVFRLSSGGSGLELVGAGHERYSKRNFSILYTVRKLNEQHGTCEPYVEPTIIGDALDSGASGGTALTQSSRFRQKMGRAAPSGIARYDKDPDLDLLNGRILFIGLGAMKAGTSWVSDYLRDDPNVLHSPIKEMNFFNQLDPNPLSTFGERFRQSRMRAILLEKDWDYPPNQKSYETLKALAELGALKTQADYCSYFARRIADQTHFGEVCPQYSLIPPQTYRRIEDMGFDTRLMFFMRDPTDRLASNIQHNLRKNSFDIDEAIAGIDPKQNWYKRSNYKTTLENFRKAGTSMRLESYVYEDLFSEGTVRRLCNFLEVNYRTPNFNKQVNVARGPKISTDQKARIRVKLDPLYRDLADYFGADKPTKWRWDN